jgi:hypothetical protein
MKIEKEFFSYSFNIVYFKIPADIFYPHSEKGLPRVILCNQKNI